MSNTEILCFVLGWQGGTVHQVADAVHEDEFTILQATADKMRELCRVAQAVRAGVIQ